MKQITYLISSIIFLIILLCIQLCLIKYEHTTTINLILIAYTYAIFAQLPIAIIAILTAMLDGIVFLLIGYFGLISMVMTFTAISLTTIKDNFYNKLIMPIAGIAIYCITEYGLFYHFLEYKVNFTEIFIAILIHSCMFTLLWWITNQPMHD